MKKINIYFIAILVLLFSLPQAAISQSTVVKGTVKGGPLGEPIVGIAVFILNGPSTVTSSSGEYSIPVSPDVEIIVSAGGIEKTFLTVEGTNWMNFWINPPDLPSDFDGNYYQTISIGDDVWMKENLKATHYRNGDPIPYSPDYTTWPIPNEAYFNYNGDEANGDIYGRLYNWNTAVDTRGVCPAGWHVPSHQDYQSLFYALGLDPNGGTVPPNLGGMLKETGTTHWNFPNTGATDEVGFTALPGGEWSGGGFPDPYDYKYLGSRGSFWSSSTISNPPGVLALTLTSTSGDLALEPNPEASALSIRCVMDNYLPTVTTTIASDITTNSALSGGDVTSEGSVPVTEAGVCWSTDPNPTTSDNTSPDGSGLGSFTSSLSSLNPNTTYYVRAYAINVFGTSYGNQISFSTLCPEITLSELVSDITCFGTNDGSISILPSGGTEPYNYAWDHGPTSPSISSLAPGSYSVTVTDANACTGGTSITLTEPEVLEVSASVTSDYNGSHISCSGIPDGEASAIPSGGTADYTYAWYDDAALSSPIGQTDNTATGLTAATYWVEVSDVNGCNASTSITLTDPPLLGVTASVSSNYNGQDISCNGASDGEVDAIPVGGTGTYTYAWYYDAALTSPVGQTTATATALGAGIYWVEVSDLNDCSASGSITLTDPPALSVNIVNTTDETCIGCDDGSISIIASGGTPGYSYLWNDPAAQTTATAIGLTAGIYNVTVTDANGCFVYAEATVNNPLIVTNTDDTGYGSLRYAINYANGRDGADQIIFNIPNDLVPTPHVIQPEEALPEFLSPIIIDGYTQPGASLAVGNNPAILMIQLDGINLIADGSACGLWISGNDCVVKGLAINRFGDAGIHIQGPAGDNYITGNHIGIDVDGISSLPNIDDGIRIINSANNTIGGNIPDQRNIISGNGDMGIEIQGTSTGTRIEGNWVGINADNASVGNGAHGIFINAPVNYVGGETEGSGNVISGNGGTGVNLTAESANGNEVLGNYIGTGMNGHTANPNALHGVIIEEGAHHNIIGNGNIISGNLQVGVCLKDNQTVGNEILGNSIGISEIHEDGDTDYYERLPNQENGIEVRTGAAGTLIGPDNVISGNSHAGVYLTYSVPPDGNTENNRVFSNLIGTDPTGDVLLANADDGVNIFNSSGNLIEDNVLVGAGTGEGFTPNNGIEILGPEAYDNTIAGNYIGTNANNTIGLGNGFQGIQIKRDAHDNTIGPGNTISGNLNHGILIESEEGTSCDNNIVVGNYIGTTVNGQNSFGNSVNGIQVIGTVSNSTIGPGNVISGNDIGVNLFGSEVDNNRVIGNYIGTDVDGIDEIPNNNGVWITEGSDNIIGGTEAGDRNIISGNNDNGIWIQGSGTAESLGNAVQGNYIGLAENGTDPLGNGGFGVKIREAAGNLVGGPEDAHRNIVSANGTPEMNRFGIFIEFGHPDIGNTVQGNYVGTDVTGMFDVGNISVGILIYNASHNKILDNLVSGNGGGISFWEDEDPGTYLTRNNIISRNQVGLKASGTEWLGNDYFGIAVQRSHDNLVGGLSPEEGNIVVGSEMSGILLSHDATGNRVLRNYVGTNPEGEVAMPNYKGIALATGVNNNIVGGNTIAFNELVGVHIDPDATENNLEGNRITGNGSEGIYLAGQDNVIGGPNEAYKNMINGPAGGIVISPEGTGNLIENNYIGTDETGSKDMAEGDFDGVQIGGSDNVVKNNLISGYGENGIDIAGWDDGSQVIPENNLVELNSIGLSKTEGEFIPNQNGIFLNSAVNNTIVNNEVAGNLGYGIQVIDAAGPTDNNRISENRIHDNGSIGINLGTDGVTQNDELDLDPDDGPNGLQNFPVLNSISFTTEDITVGGFLRSKPNLPYRIEFFASTIGDNTTYGEGMTFLDSASVKTDETGYVAFDTTLALAYYSGQVITATATDWFGNTSEFSQSIGGARDQVLAIHKPFRYSINNEALSQYSYDEIETAIKSSFQTWDDVTTADYDFEFAEATDLRHASATDNVNLVSFKDDRFPFAPGVLAVTAKTLRMKPITAENEIPVAEILDADIVFNPSYENHQTTPFAILPEGDTGSEAFDIQSVATHEIGHVLGMIHSGVYDATMFFMLGYGTEGRDLEPDDIAWASHRYPTDASKASFGYISGRVTYGDGPDPDSQPAVAGALVLALEEIPEGQESQEQIHAYTDANGYYKVPIPLEAGGSDNYWIYIQPLDGDVYGLPLKPGNISPYVYAHTVYTDFPNEFYNFEDAATGDPLTATAVEVLSQNTTRDIDLITNRDEVHPVIHAVTPEDGTDNVEVIPTMTVVFSEQMDLGSFDESTCYFEEDPGGPVIGGTYSYLDYVDTVVLVSPIKELENATDYKLHIIGSTDGITDMKGNELLVSEESVFKTIPDDGTRPKVMDVIPEHEETQVSVTSTVRVYFSEPIDLPSLENGFELLDETGAIVAGEQSWDMELLEMEYTPDLTLHEDEEYTISLSSSITDKSENGLVADIVFTFETVKVAPPELTYLGPEDLATGITAGTPIVAVFTEPINTATINGNSFKLEEVGGSPVQGEFEFLHGDTTVVFRPHDSLEFSTDYIITLTSDIVDMSVPQEHFIGTTSDFRTATGVVPMQITYLYPPSGIAGNEINIGGSGFDPGLLNNKVVFYNSVEAVVTGYDPKYLTVKVPENVTDGPVSVVVNNGIPSNTIDFDVLDLNTDPRYDWLSPERTGSNTRAVEIHPDAGYAYATNWGSGTVTPINMKDGSPVAEASIEVGDAPIDIDINPAGTKAYVTNHYSNTVSVLNVDPDPLNSSFNKWIKDIPVGDHPYGVAVSSDDKVYVANNASEYVSVIDVDPASGGFDHVVANLRTGSNNRNIEVPPDAGMILVTGLDGVAIIDRNPLSIDFNKVIARAGSGSSTRHIAITADAALAVATTDLGDILIIDIFQPPGSEFGNVIASVRTGSSPRNVTIGADAMYVYITNPEDGTVVVYQMDYSIVPGYGATLHDTEGLNYLSTLNVGEKPYALVLDPASTYLLVTHDTEQGGVTKIDIKEESIDPILTLGDLISSVYNALHNEVIDPKVASKLLEDLDKTMDRIKSNQLGSAIDHLDNFIERVLRYISRGEIPEILGNAWLEAAYRIREQLVKDLDAQQSMLKGSGETGSGISSMNDSGTDASSSSDLQIGGTLKLENRPNPFSYHTQVFFEIPNNGEADVPVFMRIFNISGQVVKTLVHSDMEPGRYSVMWNSDLDDGGSVPDGIYLLELRIPGQRKAIRISVIK